MVKRHKIREEGQASSSGKMSRQDVSLLPIKILIEFLIKKKFKNPMNVTKVFNMNRFISKREQVKGPEKGPWTSG